MRRVSLAPLLLSSLLLGACAAQTSASETGADVATGSASSAVSFAQNGVMIVNRQSGKCLTIPGANLNWGTFLLQEECDYAADSTWNIVPSTTYPGYYEIVSAMNGLCVDVYGGGTGNEIQLDAWGCATPNATNQVYAITHDGGGTHFQVLRSGRYIDVRGVSMDNGGIYQQYDGDGSPAQQFDLVPVSTASIGSGNRGATLTQENDPAFADYYTSPAILREGQYLVSPNGKYSAWMQYDGNFVVYQAGPAYTGGTNVVFATGTNSDQNTFAAMQSDGNFVIYRGSEFNRNAVWSSGTSVGNAIGSPWSITLNNVGELVISQQNFFDGVANDIWSSPRDSAPHPVAAPTCTGNPNDPAVITNGIADIANGNSQTANTACMVQALQNPIPTVYTGPELEAYHHISCRLRGQGDTNSCPAPFNDIRAEYPNSIAWATDVQTLSTMQPESVDSPAAFAQVVSDLTAEMDAVSQVHAYLDSYSQVVNAYALVWVNNVEQAYANLQISPADGNAAPMTSDAIAKLSTQVGLTVAAGLPVPEVAIPAKVGLLLVNALWNPSAATLPAPPAISFSAAYNTAVNMTPALPWTNVETTIQNAMADHNKIIALGNALAAYGGLTQAQITQLVASAGCATRTAFYRSYLPVRYEVLGMNPTFLANPNTSNITSAVNEGLASYPGQYGPLYALIYRDNGSLGPAPLGEDLAICNSSMGGGNEFQNLMAIDGMHTVTQGVGGPTWGYFASSTLHF